VKSGRFVLLAFLSILCACNRAPQTKEAVKQGVVEHLGKGSGLDLSMMDVDVTSVAFHDNEANASVMFRPKSSPEQGMQMNYTLERKGQKWVVLKKAGGGANPHGAGMPAPDAAPSPTPSGDLPPGHPPVKPSEPGK
jgi:hypothetical protein